MDRNSWPAPSTVVHIAARGFEHDGRVAKLRLPNDGPLIRSVTLKDVAPEHIDEVSFRAGAVRILGVTSFVDRDGTCHRAGELIRIMSPAGQRCEMRIEVGQVPGHGLDVTGTAIDLAVAFVEGAPDQVSLRASIEFW